MTYVMAIHTQGLDDGIRCAMCTNSMKSDRGCDGGCIVDDEMYKRVMNTINNHIFKQEPCEDAISRQAAIDINEYHHGQMPNHVNHEIWKEIKALPSVTPHPKAGKWIYTGDYITDGMLKCSECGFEHDVSERFVYCPNCGKRMEVEE